MTFFDISPAGAFFNAIGTAAKSDNQTRPMEALTNPKAAKTTISKGGFRARLRALFAPVENQAVHTT